MRWMLTGALCALIAETTWAQSAPEPTEPAVPAAPVPAAPVPAAAPEPTAPEPTAAPEPAAPTATEPTDAAAPEPAAPAPTATEPTDAASTEPSPAQDGAEPAPAPSPVVQGPAGARVVDRIAAVVNDEVIALSEVYELGGDFLAQQCPSGESGVDPACVAAAELEVLDALIRRNMIRQELARLELDVTTADVDQAIDRTVKQYQLADRQALKTEVEASGKRWDQYRDELMEFLRTQAFQARILAPRVTVSEDELRDLYQRTSRQVTTPAVRLSGLGIAVAQEATDEQRQAVLAQAAAVVEELNAGELPWDEAVTKYDVGVTGMFADTLFEPASLVEPISAAVFAAGVQADQVLPPIPVTSPSGDTVLFLIRVDEQTTRSEVAPFDELKAQLQDQLFSEKLQEAEEEWYQRARREAAIDVKIAAS
jgi:peptidyl-prolyl cis-trans isomerase SurA